MILIGEILGVLLGGAVLAGYARTRRGWAVGVALAIVGVAALLAFENGSGLVKTFPIAIAANQRLSRAAIQDAPAAAAGAATNDPFLDWARNKIIAAHRGLTYWILPISDAFNVQWVPYVLLPGVLEANPQKADWLIFFGVNPSRVAYDAAAFKPPVYYQPGYAIAERLHAS